MAEGLAEAGGRGEYGWILFPAFPGCREEYGLHGLVHCIDRLPDADGAFTLSKEQLVPEYGGSLEYHQVDVSNNDKLEKCIADIAGERQRLDGLIAGT